MADPRLKDGNILMMNLSRFWTTCAVNLDAKLRISLLFDSLHAEFLRALLEYGSGVRDRAELPSKEVVCLNDGRIM